MFARRRRDSDVRVDVSALIDVVFLLLIFFMVTTTFAEQPAVEIELPSADGESTSVERETPELLIDEQGVVRLDGEVVAIDDLAASLAARFADVPRADRLVVLRGDARADWDVMLNVMNALREAGVPGAPALTEPRSKEEDEP